MKQLIRRDIVLFVILAFSALFLAVSRPDNVDAKMVVWDYGFIMLAAATVLWLLGESVDWFFGQMGVSGADKHVKTLSRDGMLVLAESQGLGGREELSRLSDNDLMGLVLAKSNGSKGVSSGKPMSLWGLLVFIVKFWVGVVSKIFRFLNGLRKMLTMPKAQRVSALKKIKKKINKDMHGKRQ